MPSGNAGFHIREIEKGDIQRPIGEPKLDNFMSCYPKEIDHNDMDVLSSETSSKSSDNKNSIQDDRSTGNDIYMPPVKTRTEKINDPNLDLDYCCSSTESSNNVGSSLTKKFKVKERILQSRTEKSTVSEIDMEHFSSLSGSHSLGRRLEIFL